MQLADGTEILALMSIEPFRFTGQGIEFEGTVGLAVRDKAGATKMHPIRSRMRAVGQTK